MDGETVTVSFKTSTAVSVPVAVVLAEGFAEWLDQFGFEIVVKPNTNPDERSYHDLAEDYVEWLSKQ